MLIFSQMVRLLDIFETYVRLKGWKFERLDGRVRGNERQASIDRFTQKVFFFLFFFFFSIFLFLSSYNF